MTCRPIRRLLPALVLLLAACAGNPPPAARLPDMTFTNHPPFRLDVGRIEVVSEYHPPAQPPHIEYDMPISPENAIKRWVQDRLQPVGRSGTLKVIVKEASATETPLKTDTGLTSVFKTEQAARVEMSVQVSLQMQDDQHFTVAEVSGKSWRSRTEPQGQKLNERDKLLYDMVEDLMSGLDGDLDQNIRDNFGRWLGR